MSALPLTPSLRKVKRAEAQSLAPVVAIGGDGLTAAVLKEADSALSAHGLIKVRVFSDDRKARESMLTSLADQLCAGAVQHIGKLLVLWRPLAAKQKAVRDDRMAGPKVVKILKFSRSGNHRPQVKKIRVLGNQRLAAGGELKRSRKRPNSIKKAAAE